MFTRKTTVDSVIKSLNTAIEQLRTVTTVQEDKAVAARGEAQRQERIMNEASDEARRAACIANKLSELVS